MPRNNLSISPSSNSSIGTELSLCFKRMLGSMWHVNCQWYYIEEQPPTGGLSVILKPRDPAPRHPNPRLTIVEAFVARDAHSIEEFVHGALARKTLFDGEETWIVNLTYDLPQAQQPWQSDRQCSYGINMVRFSYDSQRSLKSMEARWRDSNGSVSKKSITASKDVDSGIESIQVFSFAKVFKLPGTKDK